MITEIDKLNLLLTAMDCEIASVAVGDADSSGEERARALRKSLIWLRRILAKEVADHALVR